MIGKINNWLEDKKRPYAFGLAVFLALASSEIRKKYLVYLSTDEEVKSTDPRFHMLINKVTVIYNNLKRNPNQYAEALSKFCEPIKRTKLDLKNLYTLKNRVNELNQTVADLQESGDDKENEILDFENELEDKNKQLDELKERLKSQGVKVLDAIDLPPATKEKYDRIKVLVPLMAAVHAELKDSVLTDEQRKTKAEELCLLDDEHRSLWDEIDNYLHARNSVITEEPQTEYSEDPIIRGMQIGNRIKRLNENIKRSNDFIAKHQASNKPELEKKARERLAEYESELTDLKKQVNESK